MTKKQLLSIFLFLTSCALLSASEEPKKTGILQFLEEQEESKIPPKLKELLKIYSEQYPDSKIKKDNILLSLLRSAFINGTTFSQELMKGRNFDDKNKEKIQNLYGTFPWPINPSKIPPSYPPLVPPLPTPDKK